MSAAVSPLGTLSILPRELRDEIYRLIVAGEEREHTFKQKNEYKNRRLNGQSRKKWTGDLAILESSTPIRQEGLAMLYAQGYFRIYDYLTFQYDRSDIPFVDHLSNIGLAFDVHIDDDAWLVECRILPEEFDDILCEKTAAPISFFTGTDTLRNSCVIRLTSCSPKLTLLLESPFFHAITQLTGFNSVTLAFHSDKGIWEPHVTNNDARIQLFPDFATMIVAVSSTLELTLGAIHSADIRTSDLDPVQYTGGLEWEVIFRPRDHLAMEYAGKESDSGTEGATLALSKFTLNDHPEG